MPLIARMLPPCLDEQEVIAALGAEPTVEAAVNYFVALFNDNIYPAITEVQQVMNGGIDGDNIAPGGCRRDNFNLDALRLILEEIGLDGATIEGIVRKLYDDNTWIEADETNPGEWTISHIGPSTGTGHAVTAGAGNYITEVTITYDAKGHVTAASGATATLPSGGSTQASVPLPPLSWFPSAGTTTAYNNPASLGWIYSGASTTGPAPTIPVWVFPDTTASGENEQIETIIPVPVGFDGSGELTISCAGSTVSTGTDTVTWNLRAASMGNGDNAASKAFDTTNKSNMSFNFSEAYDQTSQTIAITNDSSLQLGDDLHLVLYRDLGDADDDYAGTIYMKSAKWTHGVG